LYDKDNTGDNQTQFRNDDARIVVANHASSTLNHDSALSLLKFIGPDIRTFIAGATEAFNIIGYI